MLVTVNYRQLHAGNRWLFVPIRDHPRWHSSYSHACCTKT